MAGELKTSVIIDLSGNLANRARKYGRALGDFSSRGRRQLNRLKSTAAATGRTIGRMGNRYTAMGGAVAAAASARGIINMDARMEALGIQAGRTTEEMQALKREIFATATTANIRVNPDQILDAIEEIVEKTGNLKFARDNIENIGLAMRATGAAGRSTGGIMAEFEKMGILDPKAVLESLDILTVQGKEGAFTLKDLARMGSRTVTAYTAMGRTGVPAIREMGAALQVIRQGTGSSEMATTAFEALLRTLSDAKKVGILQKGGIQVFDPKALKEGREVLRPINQLMVEIIKKTGGKKTVLSRVFDAEAMRAFNAALGQFNRTGGVAMMDRFMNVTADGSNILADAERNANTAAAALTNLSTAWKKVADAKLTGVIQGTANLMNKLGPDKTGNLMLGTAGLVGAAGLSHMTGGRLGKGAYKAGRGTFRAGRGLARLGIGLGARALPALLAAGPVGWAIGGALALGVGGYGAYKYLNRDKGNVAPSTRAQSPFFGTLRIELDQNGRVRGTSFRDVRPGLGLEVDTGLMMQGAG